MIVIPTAALTAAGAITLTMRKSGSRNPHASALIGLVSLKATSKPQRQHSALPWIARTSRRETTMARHMHRRETLSPRLAAPAASAASAAAPAVPPPAEPDPAKQTQTRRSGGFGGAGKPAPSKPMIPDWAAHGDETPADSQLNELRAQVQASPRDRKLRNAYADALLNARKFDNLQAEVFQWLSRSILGESRGLRIPRQECDGIGRSGFLALRAYSSIAEIAPNRAALLARAGFLLLTATEIRSRRNALPRSGSRIARTIATCTAAWR